MILALPAPPAIDGLLQYFRSRLSCPDLDFREAPEPIDDGWETYIYRFRLQSRRGLPAELARPLILRLYSCACGLDRLRHEFDVQRHMHRIGYAVPRPLLIESSDEHMGGPFMVMHRLPGRTLLEEMFRKPWRIWSGPTQMAAAHAKLHRQSTQDFPADQDDFLGRHLKAMAQAIELHGLDGLAAGREWLMRQAPAEVEAPCIVHLDVHPINLMVEGGRTTGLLDWVEADLGDRHADLATTLLLIRSAPIEAASMWRRWSMIPGKWMLYRRYLKGYLRELPIDGDRLDYYLAWATLRRLVRYGIWLRAGPLALGCKPSLLRYLNAQRIGVLCRLFQEYTGVHVRLELEPSPQVFPIGNGSPAERMNGDVGRSAVVAGALTLQ